ncbi:MAG TPA: response regulator transcription factor [Anaerolineales bacterium]|nr:response regulator transcription factor [Anaerolineales bacterium]
MQISHNGKSRTYSQAHILVFSDDQEISRVWGFCLEQSGLSVDLAGMNDQALQIMLESMPDMVVVDSHAWQGEDIEFCRQLRKDNVIPLLLFTSQNDEYYLLDAYQVGVDEVVAQPISPRLFMAKIRSWLRRIQHVPSAALDVLMAGGFILNEEQRSLQLPDRREVRLTYLEARLLYVLMTHPDLTQDTETLVERVWGHYGQGESVLVKNLVYRLRRKIEIDPSHPRLLLTDENRGYRFSSGI